MNPSTWQVVMRRTELPEDALLALINKITGRLRARFPEREQQRLKARDQSEAKEMETPPPSPLQKPLIPKPKGPGPAPAGTGAGEWARDEALGQLAASLGDMCLPAVGREPVALALVEQSLGTLLGSFRKLRGKLGVKGVVGSLSRVPYLLGQWEFAELEAANGLRFFEAALKGAAGGAGTASASVLAAAERMIEEAARELAEGGPKTGGALGLAVEGERVCGGFVTGSPGGEKVGLRV